MATCSPLSYPAGRRPLPSPSATQGGPNSAPTSWSATNYSFGGWRDNFGWAGQYGTLTVVEMDNKVGVTDPEISPTDRRFGVVGEGQHQRRFVTNTGMDTLNGKRLTSMLN